MNDQTVTRKSTRTDIWPAGYGYARSAAVCIWAGIFLMVMSVLTVLDLPVARAIYHYSDVYGRIFEIAGVVPTCMMGAFFAVSNLATRHIARRKVLSAEKGELVLNLLEVREEVDALLADAGLSGKEKRSLMRIRKLDSRFLREVRLRNYEDIYASAVK